MPHFLFSILTKTLEIEKACMVLAWLFLQNYKASPQTQDVSTTLGQC